MGTLETIRNLLVEEFQLDPANVQADTELETLGVDSLSVIEFMFMLEDKFKVSMPQERVVVKTVRDIANELDALIIAQHGRSSPRAAKA
jgi:acyl carrier protein